LTGKLSAFRLSRVLVAGARVRLAAKRLYRTPDVVERFFNRIKIFVEPQSILM